MLRTQIPFIWYGLYENHVRYEDNNLEKKEVMFKEIKVCNSKEIKRKEKEKKMGQRANSVKKHMFLPT